MRYIVFLSFESKDKARPNLDDLIGELDIDILSGPTENGLYLVDGSHSSIELLKFLAYPFYILMEDFDPPIIH